MYVLKVYAQSVFILYKIKMILCNNENVDIYIDIDLYNLFCIFLILTMLNNLIIYSC